MRGVLVGIAIGAVLAGAPVVVYRVWRAPGAIASRTAESGPGALTPSGPERHRRGLPAQAAAPEPPTPPAQMRSRHAPSTAQPTRAPSPAATTNRILANLARQQAPGFPPPRQGLLSEPDLRQALDRAAELIEAGALEAAHELLSTVYFRPALSEPQRAELTRVLEPLADRLLHSLDPPAYGRVHVVQPGDTPARIARPFKIPHRYLARLNGFGRYIRVGQRLKLINGPFDVLIELGNFELVVLLQGRFIKRYRIGIGRDGSSPTGLFRVMQKVVNPTWYPSEGGVVPPDDPRNPLGTRWIGIGGSYGIHGTREPESIGKAESRGCIRMRNRDVEELYDMLIEEHSRVLIRP